MNSSFVARIKRGHLFSRLMGRIARDTQHIVTTLVLSTTRPEPGRVAIVTLNPDEENATAQAILVTETCDVKEISLISPDPPVSRVAVALAARRLGREIPENLQYTTLGFWHLLRAYRLASTTYSTHVLLPGRDFSGRRRHVHLTHGSGPKPDTTFRAPTNVLASITPQWVDQQLSEYKLPSTTEVIDYMPRLEIMRNSIGDRNVVRRLGFDPTKPLIVWAPTYRKIRRGQETRVSGTPISANGGGVPPEIVSEVTKRDANLVLKVHPHDADDYGSLGIPVLTNAFLQKFEVTPYELFGAADLLITDYSSVYLERKKLGLPYLLVRSDYSFFADSYRGLR